MSKFIVAVAIAGSLAGLPITVSAQKVRSVRQVQLIAMGNPASKETIPVPADPNPILAPLPDAFRVHDLSRRYVEYRMAQEMVAPDGDRASALGVTGYLGTGVAPISSISVPGWMKGQYTAIPAVSYTPGCTPQAYRPSGFLRPDAEARRATYYGMMSAIACEQGIPTGLFDAMIIRESRYNPGAVSTKSAYGFAQLMPGTAGDLGVNRFDPTQNMRGGARYLRQQLDKFGQVHLALAAYNAGPGRIRHGMIPRIAETQAYVSNIIANWSRLSGTSEVTTPARPVPTSPQRSVAIATY
jgi:hypothetical protein